MTLSFFERNNKPCKSLIEFEDYIELIRDPNPSYRKRIAEARKIALTDVREYKVIKAGFPAVVVSGVIPIGKKREDANVCAHTGICSLDFDPGTNPVHLFDDFNDKQAFAWHSSLSGRGLVVFYAVDMSTTTHIDAFNYLSARAADEFGLVADKQVSSISSFRFMSYDPDAVYYPKRIASPLTVPKRKPKKEQTTTSKDLSADREQLRDLTKHLVKVKGNIVEERDEWVKIAAVYARTFNGDDEGLELFDQLSQLSRKYRNIRDCRKVYNSFIKSTHHAKPTIASMVYMMKEHKVKEAPTGGGGTLKQYSNKPTTKKTTRHEQEDDETDEPEEYVKSWRDFLLTEEPAPEVPLISIGDIVVCSEGNQSLVLGKKKSRKSLFIALLCSLYRSPDMIDKEVLLVDTEQGKRHAWFVRERIKKLTGKYIRLLYLRGESPAERLRIVGEAVREIKPAILINDGIRDFMRDINSTEETSEVITWLEKIMVEVNTHVMNVLHLNKTDSNARGHIGSELLNKAETVFELELDKNNDLSIVKCEASRDRPFEQFAFTHDLNGLPHIIDMPEVKQKYDPVEVNKKLAMIFEDAKELSYEELVTGIRDFFELGDTRAKQLVAKLKFDNVLKSTKGKAHSKDSKYSFSAPKSK